MAREMAMPSALIHCIPSPRGVSFSRVPIVGCRGAEMADAATLKPPKPRSTAAPTAAPARAFAMLSHRGRVRSANQDVCAALPEHGTFVVSDGMGGAAGGEIASRMATEAFLDCLAHRRCPPLDAAASEPVVTHSAAGSSASRNSVAAHSPLRTSNGSHPAVSVAQPRARLAEAVRAANQAVFQHARKSPNLHGMGTTLVALLCDPAALQEEAAPLRKAAARPGPAATLWLAHVGDSRCYLFRRGALHQLTQDHSLVEEQVRAGVLSRVQAAASPMCNVITRAVGTQSSVEAEIACHAPQPGDLYLLASDGLTRELDDAAIAQILTRAANPAMTAAASGPDDARRIVASNGPANNGCTHNGCAPQSALQAALDAACKTLVDAANAHGGRDNITVLLVAFP